MFVFSLWFAVVGAFVKGDCKLLETEIARIYVPTCCCKGVLRAGSCRTAWLLEGERTALPTHTWILTDGNLLTYTWIRVAK